MKTASRKNYFERSLSKFCKLSVKAEGLGTVLHDTVREIHEVTHGIIASDEIIRNLMEIEESLITVNEKLRWLAGKSSFIVDDIIIGKNYNNPDVEDYIIKEMSGD